jgi:fatty-acyl-CoA synthase
VTCCPIRHELPELREAVSFGDWSEFCDSGSAEQSLPVVTADSPAQIQFTSGTTGSPKGAVLHHRGITNNARLSYARIFGLQPGDACVNPMPLFHTAGCVLATLSSIATLGTHVLMPYFDPALQLQLVETERSVSFVGVPTMLIAMLDHPAFAGTDTSSVRFALSGGAPVPASLVRRVENALGVPMSIIYAQTEASPGIAQTVLGDDRADREQTVGRALPATEVKVVDAGGATVSVGGAGELCTRGYHVMSGYVDAPEQTAAAIDAQGWLRTGDLATMDERGFLRITGRIKDMVIRGGENIYPREIEQVLFDHPGVADVAVVGVPDPKWGEEVAAFVRATPGRLPDEAELVEFCRGRLARHKIPRFWTFVSDFPMTGSGKIQKHVLREQFVSSHQPATPRT